MKKIVLFIILMIAVLFGPQAFAGEIFTLGTPVTVEPQAYGGEITSYQIVPGSGGRLIIHFQWRDDVGNTIGRPQSVEWSGSDFSDIFGHLIELEDAGTAIGVMLRSLIHNKIETKYGVDIQ